MIPPNKQRDHEFVCINTGSVKREKDTKHSNIRFFIAAFVIFLEFAQLLAVFIILNMFSSVMMALSYIFNFCVLLYVINREEIPEFKLPWLILILLLPMKSDFVDTMAQSETITTEKVKLSAPQKLTRNIMKVFFPLL